MKMKKLSENDVYKIADKTAPVPSAFTRVADQFDRQAMDCRRLADQIEDRAVSVEEE